MSRIWRVITAALSCLMWVPKKRPSPLCVLALDPSSGHLTRTSVFLCHFQSSNSEYTGFLAPLCHWTPFCRPQDGWEVGGWGQWAVPGILTDPKIGLFWYAGGSTVHYVRTLDSSRMQRASKSVFLAGGYRRRVLHTLHLGLFWSRKGFPEILTPSSNTRLTVFNLVDKNVERYNLQKAWPSGLVWVQSFSLQHE